MNSTTLFFLGSRRATVFFGEFDTHTAWSTTIQSGAPGTSKMASGLRRSIGILMPGGFTPGRGARAGCPADGAVSAPMKTSAAIGRGRSRENVMNDVPGYVREPEIAPAVAIGELGVIDAHQVQDRGVQ